jgi:hypothetical protein
MKIIEDSISLLLPNHSNEVKKAVIELIRMNLENESLPIPARIAQYMDVILDSLCDIIHKPVEQAVLREIKAMTY